MTIFSLEEHLITRSLFTETPKKLDFQIRNTYLSSQFYNTPSEIFPPHCDFTEDGSFSSSVLLCAAQAYLSTTSS